MTTQTVSLSRLDAALGNGNGHMPIARRKTLYTLAVNGFSKEITAMTFPLLEAYADKTGADFHVITERKDPNGPAISEKFQVRELAAERGDEWSLFIDADALVHPDLPDVTEIIPKDTVAHNGHDMGQLRWKSDKYFKRDGRWIGSCTWFVLASEWTVADLWAPLDISREDAIQNITPLRGYDEQGHREADVKSPASLLDDYTLSRNIARYGLKYVSLRGLLPIAPFWHEYLIPPDEKVVKMRAVLKGWNL